ncbi:hypothetical protein D3C72_120650 [compost metagenome]
MADMNVNTPRPMTGPLRQTAPLGTSPLNAAAAGLAAEKSQITRGTRDLMEASLPTAEPPGASVLSNRAASKLSGLSSGVRQMVLSEGITDVMPTEAKQDQIRTNLKREISSLVPGGVTVADAGAKWSASDLAALHDVIKAMPAADRQALSGMVFEREGALAMKGGDYHSNVKSLFKGEDLTSGSIGGGAYFGAQSTDGGEEKPGGLRGMFSKIRDFFRNLGIKIFKPLMNEEQIAQFKSQAPEGKIVLTHSGSMVAKDLLAHEVGHMVQMNGGRWDPAKIKEFSQLSGWTEQYQDGTREIADGIDNRTGEMLKYESGIVKPTRDDNFVSQYAKADPIDDFAESYRAYLNDPSSLMAAAPEKLLFVNAQSGKYTRDEVAQLAQKAGVDLQDVFTNLVLDGNLKQETLNAISEMNGVQADKRRISSGAEASNGDALAEATSKITAKAIVGDTGFVNQLLSNPQAALGAELWESLSADEQDMLKDREFVRGIVSDLGAGRASAASAGLSIKIEIAREGVRDTFSLLGGTDGKAQQFRTALAADPELALKKAGLWDKLPEELRKPFVDPANRQAVQQLAQAVSASQPSGKMGWLIKVGNQSVSPEVAGKNLESYVKQLQPEHFKAFAERLNDPEFGGKSAQVLQSVIKTGQAPSMVAGGPGGGL